jgi:hypothetical protein
VQRWVVSPGLTGAFSAARPVPEDARAEPSTT